MAARLVAVVAACVALSAGALAAQPDRQWLRESTIDRNAVGRALNALTGLSASDALREAEDLRNTMPVASAAGKELIPFLYGVALQQAGETEKARQFFSGMRDGTYAASSAYRLWLLEDPQPSLANLRQFCKSVTIGSSEGWVQRPDGWAWMPTGSLECKVLIDREATYLSFRALARLRSLSLLSPPYAWLWMLLVLGVLIKLLELPFTLRMLRSGEWTVQLVLVDILFAVWVLTTMMSFEPQLRLDGSMAFGSDVTRPDLGIVLLLVVADLLANATLPRALRLRARSVLGGAVVISLVAGFGEWPAYWLVFWVLLRVLSAATHLALKPFVKAAA